MKKIAAALLVLSFTSLSAQTFNQISGTARRDINDAISLKEKLEQEHNAKLQPLKADESKLQDEAFELRDELGRILRRRDNTDRDLNSLRNEVKSLKQQNAYITSLLGEFIRGFDNRLHISEQQLYTNIVEDAVLTSEDINLSAAERFGIQLKVLDEAVVRMENLIGGNQFDGSAVVPGGRVKDGKFTQMGPIYMFSSPENNVAGLARREFGSSQAFVTSLGAERDALVTAYSDSQAGSLPFDFTLGAAIQVEAAKDTFLGVVKKGGWVMYPILGMAGLALLISLYKWFEISGIRRARPKDLTFILDALHQGNQEGAMQYANKIKGPVGALLTSAVQNHQMDKEHIEEVLYEKLIESKPKLERLLAFIAITSATAPLWGLLGTVTGMIKTFQLITIFGTGDAKSLSSGISEALITTEFGLIVAIPSLIFHAMLSRKAKGVLSSMQRTAIGFINGMPRR